MSKGTPLHCFRIDDAAALAAQQAMREASHKRDAAVLAARRAGVPAAELAAALGVNRHRVHAMIKAAEVAITEGAV